MRADGARPGLRGRARPRGRCGDPRADRRSSRRRLAADRVPFARGLPRRALRFGGNGGALRRRAARLRRRRHPPRRRDAAACRSRTPTCCACSKRPTAGRKSSAARCAKPPRTRCRSAQAFEHWRTRHGHLFNEFVAESLKHVAETRGRPRAQAHERIVSRRSPAAAGARGAGAVRRFTRPTDTGRCARSRAAGSTIATAARWRPRRRCRCGSSDGSSPKSIGSPSSGCAAATGRSSNTSRCSQMAPSLAPSWARCSGRTPSAISSRRACARPVPTFARRSRRSSASSKSSRISAPATSCRSISTTSSSTSIAS